MKFFYFFSIFLILSEKICRIYNLFKFLFYKEIIISLTSMIKTLEVSTITLIPSEGMTLYKFQAKSKIDQNLELPHLKFLKSK